MTLFMQEKSKKIRKLIDPKLRKIRYEIRTLIYLLYQNKLTELRNKYISSDSKRDNTLIHQEKEDLDLAYYRHPISCWYCGNRMNDLIQDSDTLFWFCSDHST